MRGSAVGDGVGIGIVGVGIVGVGLGDDKTCRAEAVTRGSAVGDGVGVGAASSALVSDVGNGAASSASAMLAMASCEQRCRASVGDRVVGDSVGVVSDGDIGDGVGMRDDVPPALDAHNLCVGRTWRVGDHVGDGRCRRWCRGMASLEIVPT